MPRVTITVPDQNSQPYRFQLDRRTVTLGRGSDNDIAIDSQSVSVKHAEMVRIEGGYEIRDIGSTNGTKIHGERRMVIPLVSGTTVHLGDVAFDFQLSEDEEQALAAEAPGISPIVREEPAYDDRRSLAGAPASSGRSGGVMFLIFLVLAAATFFAGLAIRHQKETGHSLIDDLTKKKPAKEAPAKTEEAAAPAAAKSEDTPVPTEPAAPGTPTDPAK